MVLSENIRRQLRELARLTYEDKGGNPEMKRRVIIKVIYRDAPQEILKECISYFNSQWQIESARRSYEINLQSKV